MRISDWSSDVCSSDLPFPVAAVFADLRPSYFYFPAYLCPSEFRPLSTSCIAQPVALPFLWDRTALQTDRLPNTTKIACRTGSLAPMHIYALMTWPRCGNADDWARKQQTNHSNPPPHWSGPFRPRNFHIT